MRVVGGRRLRRSLRPPRQQPRPRAASDDSFDGGRLPTWNGSSTTRWFEQTARVPRLHISRYTLDALRQYQEPGDFGKHRKPSFGVGLGLAGRSQLPEDGEGLDHWPVRIRLQRHELAHNISGLACWFGGAQICGQSKSFDQAARTAAQFDPRSWRAQALEPSKNRDVTVGSSVRGEGPEDGNPSTFPLHPLAGRSGPRALHRHGKARREEIPANCDSGAKRSTRTDLLRTLVSEAPGRNGLDGWTAGPAPRSLERGGSRGSEGDALESEA